MALYDDKEVASMIERYADVRTMVDIIRNPKTDKKLKQEYASSLRMVQIPEYKNEIPLSIRKVLNEKIDLVGLEKEIQDLLEY